MKTLLITTDFSANSNHAARYGYQLACQIKADVVLCNAIIIPAEIPQAGFVVFPTDEYQVLMESSSSELNELKQELEFLGSANSFRPHITCDSESGVVSSVVASMVANYNIGLVMAGAHGNNGIVEFMMGDHTRSLIDSTTQPLLLVPPEFVFKPVARIALALDLRDPAHDIAVAEQLLPLARALNAEILLTHIYQDKQNTLRSQQYPEQLLKEFSHQMKYPHIKTLLIKDDAVEAGLQWLCKYGKVDMLAMAHRPHSFFESVFIGSHTKKMAGKMCIPLLVLPLQNKK